MAYYFNVSMESKFADIRLEPFGDDDVKRLQAKTAWVAENRAAQEKLPTAMPSECFPSAARLIKGKRIYDIDSPGEFGKFLVSPAFKALAEQLEGERQQFVPLKIYHKDGSFYRDYFMMRILPFIDAINPALGGVKKARAPNWPEDLYFWDIVDTKRDCLAVYAERMKGLALWHDKRQPTRFFMSDAFFELAKKNKLQGFDVQDHWAEI